ncbi:MAG TPA: glycosyltransferase [Gaiellaceae bacterium]|nr:glycosyltransferase [Gaiellaceae bacterium]
MPERTLLVVSHRPLDAGGGGSVRWRHLRRVLPEHGWRVVECSPPAGATAQEMSTDSRTAMLAARRAQVTAVAGRLLDPLARVLRVKPEAFAPNNLWALTGRSLIREAIARERPDVVVATSPPVSALLATAGVAGDVPMVADLRDLWAGHPYYDRGSPVLARLEGRALAQATTVVTVTDGCRDGLLRLHPELAQRVHVLPNGFDPALLARRAERQAPHHGPATLIFAGALYGDHTAEALVEALARPELRGRVRLELVGLIDPRTRRAVAAADADVTIEPPISWESSTQRVVAADIAVVITTPETGGDMALPIKLTEALALGCPVLAIASPGSDMARLLERLEQETGLATPHDPASIAAAIERLLAHPPPPPPTEALADFDADQMAGRYAALLDDVATRSSSATSSGTTVSRR